MGTKKLRERGKEGTTSVANALFNKVQQRVLGVLFGNPGRTFFTNEIIRVAAAGTGAVQRELARLESAGLVTTQRVGNQKHFQANVNAPVFPELRALVLKTSGLADQLRAALAARTSDIRAAFIYGSVAKQQDTATSDVDVMIISDELTYADLFPLLEETTRILGRTVNPTVYSVAEFAKRIGKRNAFITRVFEQPKIWLVGNENDLTSLAN